MPRQHHPKHERATSKRTGQTVRGNAHDKAAEPVDEALEEAPDLGQLALLQVERASDEWVRAAQACNSMLTALFDVQSAYWRSLEATMRVSLAPWMAAVPDADAPEAPLDTPRDLSPQGMLLSTLGAWENLGRAYINALDHDLGAQPR